MSSTVLARKYRPRNFETLVGQAHVVQALANALTQQRLHHAYLFTGTRGVGKTTIARILAKSLNCTGPDGSGGITAQPCGVCAACRDIDAGRFIDYVELDAASNRGVDEITRLLDQAVYKPVVGRFKVYLIDEVHMLSTTAFNAMLKTLEEPPDYLKFILATTDPQKVPATVLSRCLQFNLRPMAPETIVRHLTSNLATEDVVAEPGALKLIARAARGSMRDAQSLADQAIAYGSGRIEEAAVRQMLGAVDRSHAARCIEAAAARDGAALIGAVDGLRELGLSAGGALEEMAALLQEMAIVQAVPSALADDDADSAVARRLAALLPADETQLLYSMVLAGRAEIALAPDEYSGLVMVLLRMLAFAPADERAAPAGTADADRRAGCDAAQRQHRFGAQRRGGRAACAGARRRDSRARRGDDIGGVAGFGFAVCSDGRRDDDLERRSGGGVDRGLFRRRRLGRARPAPRRRRRDRRHGARTGDAGRVRSHRRRRRRPPLAVARRAREPAHAGAARAPAGGASRRPKDAPVRLEIEAGAVVDTPAARDAAERDRRQAEAERVIQDDPLVKALMAQYKTARIVPGSVRPPPAPTP